SRSSSCTSATSRRCTSASARRPSASSSRISRWQRSSLPESSPGGGSASRRCAPAGPSGSRRGSCARGCRTSTPGPPAPPGSTGYPWQTHLVTAAKFFEYALLAPAVMLVVRRRADLFLVVCTLIAWSVIATGVGVAQFVGANIFVSGATGGRQLSFLGFHDF